MERGPSPLFWQTQASSAAREAELGLGEHGKRLEGFQVELEESNARFGSHKEALAAATKHLAQAEAAHAPLKQLKTAEVEGARLHKELKEELQAEASKIAAQVDRLKAVCATLQEEILRGQEAAD